MKNSSFLIDLTKCTGCRSCQVACKNWNELQSEDTENTGTYQNPPQFVFLRVADDTVTLVVQVLFIGANSNVGISCRCHC